MRIAILPDTTGKPMSRVDDVLEMVGLTAECDRHVGERRRIVASRSSSLIASAACPSKTPSPR
jgi:hypothetical protein